MQPMRDFAQLQRHFLDQIQGRDELIRPLVLLEEGTPMHRAQETHTHPDTVRTFTRRFRRQGMPGLFPKNMEVIAPQRARKVPEAVIQEIARLKALSSGFQYRELVRIIYGTFGSRLAVNTVKKLWQHSLPATQGELALGDYHSDPDRYHARVQVMKLYSQGWNKLSISHVLHVSRPTVNRWIARFEAEHFAGLVDKSRAPKAPARKVW
jgi:transposase